MTKIHDTREKRELVCAAIKAACDNKNNKIHIIFNSVAGRVTQSYWTTRGAESALTRR